LIDVMLKLKQTIKTSHSDIRGCFILSNGKMVFTNWSSGEIIVLHKDGSMDNTIDISPGHPRDVTCIDSNTIAVSVIGGYNQVVTVCVVLLV
jgi:hypothetical protein